MLRAGRARVYNRAMSVLEQAKQAVVSRVRHARDASGKARSGTTMHREPLPCEMGAVSGDEMSEDEGHWFIENLVWGPYQHLSLCRQTPDPPLCNREKNCT